MPESQSPGPRTRSEPRRLLLGALAFAGFGMVGGWGLGQLAIGQGLYRAASGEIRSSFAELSGNPEAITTDSPALTPSASMCPGCAAAERLRAARYDSPGDEFHAIEPVEIAYPPIYDSIDEYPSEPAFDVEAPPAAAVKIKQIGDSRLVTLSSENVPPPPKAPLAIQIPPAPTANR